MKVLSRLVLMLDLVRLVGIFRKLWRVMRLSWMVICIRLS